MRPLITAAFHLVDTIGLPLSVVVAESTRRGFAISIPHFYRDAVAAGWNEDTAITRIEEALADNHVLHEHVNKMCAWLRHTGGRHLPREAVDSSPCPPKS